MQPMNLELYGAEQRTYYENFSVLLPFARADYLFDWWIIMSGCPKDELLTTGNDVAKNGNADP